jgi:hypothetical protein
VLIGLSGMWHGAKNQRDATIDLGLLVSNDGVHFREPRREWIFLKHGKDGQWDEGGLLQGQGFENVGDKTFIWYGSWDPRQGLDYRPRGGVGLATLPRDRFGSLSLRSAKRPAEFVTSTVNTNGCDGVRLWLNADGLGEDALLRVELLDERERPLRGFSGDEAAIVRESGFRTPVSWKKGREAVVLPARFRLRVLFEGQHSERIRFYAAYLSV